MTKQNSLLYLDRIVRHKAKNYLEGIDENSLHSLVYRNIAYFTIPEIKRLYRKLSRIQGVSYGKDLRTWIERDLCCL
jgi:hypothetical protein